MANTIQIKRSLGSTAPVSLAEGEMAYTYGASGKILYLGAPSNTIVQIGGEGAFAKLDSPTFIGTPAAPTATLGTNTTQLATTAFVQAAITAASVPDGDKGDITVSGSTWTIDNLAVTNAKINDVALSKVTGLSTVGNNLATLTNPSAITFIRINADNSVTARSASDFLTDLSAASTSYVDTAISNLVGGAGAALDTLNELAAALGNDANFATTVSTSLSEKLVKTANLSDLDNVATARTNLGLGTMAVQNANAVSITGGTIDGVTIDGGTF